MKRGGGDTPSFHIFRISSLPGKMKFDCINSRRLADGARLYQILTLTLSALHIASPCLIPKVA